MLTLSCPHCQHARDVEHARVPRARIPMKCPGCGQRFELDGAALHEAEPELELDLERMPARPAAPPPAEPLVTEPPERAAAAPRPTAALPSGGRPSSSILGLLAWTVPTLALLLLLGHCSVTSFYRPTFLQLRWSSEGADLSHAAVMLVFLHGSDASSPDVPGFARAVLERAGRNDLTIVLPEGPFSQRFVRAWYQSNYRADREESRARTIELISDLSTRHGIPAERIFVGGFSQGAGLALEVAQTYPGKLGGAVILSACGFPKGEIPSMRVLIGHSRNDALCPFAEAEGVARKLTVKGGAVQFTEHPGGHAMPEAIEAATAYFLLAAGP